jgi:outer membrane biosynthesis protein TonB
VFEYLQSRGIATRLCEFYEEYAKRLENNQQIIKARDLLRDGVQQSAQPIDKMLRLLLDFETKYKQPPKPPTQIPQPQPPPPPQSPPPPQPQPQSAPAVPMQCEAKSRVHNGGDDDDVIILDSESSSPVMMTTTMTMTMVNDENRQNPSSFCFGCFLMCIQL